MASPPPRDAPPILRGEIYWLHSKERGALPGVHLQRAEV